MDGFSRVLLQDYSTQLDEQGRHYVLRMREGAQRMGRMIDELLQISRVARSVMHREQVDLSSLARQIASELQSSEPIVASTLRSLGGSPRAGIQS